MRKKYLSVILCFALTLLSGCIEKTDDGNPVQESEAPAVLASESTIESTAPEESNESESVIMAPINDFELIDDEYGLTITRYFGDMTSFAIPSQSNGKRIVGIGVEAFMDCTNIESITIPDSINFIGTGAFKNCVNLEKIIIPEGVSTISEGTFQNCTSLGDVTISNPDTFIFPTAFDGSKFKKDQIESTGFFIVNNVLHFAPRNKELVEIPDGVTEIFGMSAYGGMGAFNGNDKIIDVIMPDSVVSIGSFAFADCINLKHIVMSNSIESINANAFIGCNSLDAATINIPANIKEICKDNNDYEILTGQQAGSVQSPTEVYTPSSDALIGTWVAYVDNRPWTYITYTLRISGSTGSISKSGDWDNNGVIYKIEVDSINATLYLSSTITDHILAVNYEITGNDELVIGIKGTTPTTYTRSVN